MERIWLKQYPPRYQPIRRHQYSSLVDAEESFAKFADTQGRYLHGISPLVPSPALDCIRSVL